jgi:hypothetical protein
MTDGIEFGEFANIIESDAFVSPDTFGEKTCDEIHSVELTHPERTLQPRVMDDLQKMVLDFPRYTYKRLGGVYEHFIGTTVRVEDLPNSIQFDVFFQCGDIVVYPYYSPPADALQGFIDDVGSMWGL